MTETVFLSAGEHECCGPLVRVGDFVEWPVARIDDASARLAQGLGDAAARVTYAYVFHEDSEQRVALRVQRIQACYALHRASLLDERAIEVEPFPGTARFREQRRTRRREYQWGDLDWTGYLVDGVPFGADAAR